MRILENTFWLQSYNHDFVLLPGFYLEPAIFTDVKDGMFIATEESFGPVMIISRFPDGYVRVVRIN